MTFPDRVATELKVARDAHGPMHSAHEAVSVIAEELDEFWDEVRKKQFARNRQQMLTELVQVAAMCQRAAEDLGLV